MTIGIYARFSKTPLAFNEINPEILNGLKCMYLNNFDSYKTYTEFVENEFTDMSERTELNRVIYDAENGLIDAVFVSDIRIFSPLSIKALQAILLLQELGMNVYHTNGYIKADDKNIKLFKTQFEENWERFNEISKGIDFGG